MKKSKRSPTLFLRDILEAIEKIEGYSKGLSFKEFSSKPLIIDAVVRNLEIIGEAVKNIPKEIKESYPDIPWKGMAGMRDKLIHEYFGVDVKILWKTIKKDLPSVKSKIKQIFERLMGNE